ncbi:MAG TPA: hypothetical protein VNM91_04630 [Dehalococcoidia bacterium]|nr:hypothetical protein [Dehalococcoidia bacterium]
MNARHISSALLRLGALATLVAALLAGFLAGGTDTPVVDANHKGTMRVDPTTDTIIIEGHHFVVPITMQTCYPPLTDPQCKVGAYQQVVAWDPAKFTLNTDSGTSTGGNTTTVLKDTTKSWRVNEWKNSTLTITAGNLLGQFKVVSNNATSVTVTPAFPVVPDTTVEYELGGLTDGWWLGSTGREIQCPGGSTYGPNGNWAELGCVTFGAPSQGYPDGVTNFGPLTYLTLVANFNARGLHNICIVNGSSPNCTLPGDLPSTAQTSVVLELDGDTIHSNNLNGVRRIIECPDPDGNGTIHSADLGLIAAAFGQNPGDPLYATNKDLDLNGTIGASDLGITAAVFLKRCNQP